jgi:hypothetical protein
MSAKTRAGDESLHQKGANGLLAEYGCACRLAEFAEAMGVPVTPCAANLRTLLRAQQQKYRHELTGSEFARAANQGVALGDHVFEQLSRSPENLGLPAGLRLAEHALSISSTGHDTSKADCADIELELTRRTGGGRLQLPIRFKAYASTTTSLGSKAAMPSLGRLFMGQRKPTRADLTARFGEPARKFLDLLDDFKAVAHEFYSESQEGRAFVEAYFQRKGTQKVNNKLRRKELGDYFHQRRGFDSEHRFAQWFAQMFTDGYLEVQTTGQWSGFIAGMLFLLGMTNDILTLNAVAGADSSVTRAENSLLSTTHGRLKRALRPGVVVELISTDESGTLRVVIRNEDETLDCLGFSLWKDATIQFKLTT